MSNLSVSAPLYSAADRDFAAPSRDAAGRTDGLLAVAGVVAAAGGLPDHPGRRASCLARALDTVAALVTGPLERAVRPDPALASLTSASFVTASARSRCCSISTATSTARRRTSRPPSTRRARRLPQNLPYPPTYSKVNPADAPIMTLALTPDAISVRALSDSRRHAAGATAQARFPALAA